MIPEERETVVRSSDADEWVDIYSCRRSDITKLRKNNRVEELSSAIEDGTEVARFRVRKEHWNPVSGVKVKRRPLTDEERAVVAERLAKARKA